ncbi:methylglyoxal reductase (NADPH-dependent) gre2 [Rhodotorula mucilaginosa]|uniref:Methylglyoxal reductase (NADPH-dependent) gre2 n=1 Tax=Rhodotorula mucilaginosa TaxID=5537 RepID=A0A9P6W3S6_RHOMI|nr:methylglyoxal reductase (NADPH-dependent) gre2 [Rhodotorula mucilaginosa]
MPTVPKGSLVLISGPSGFLGAHCAQQLLEHGFRVRGTVRSQDKGQYLADLFKKQGYGEDKFEFVIVEDVEAAGAFDEAIKGVDAFLHTASPFHFNVTDPHKDLINPAVQGTLNALKSAASEPKVKRVVITASFACIMEPKEPGTYVFTEKDWNEHSLKQVEEKGKDVDGGQAYRASKTYAERAAWKWVESEKPAFDITTIQPPLIFGPVIHQVPSPDKLNTSVNNFYQFLVGKKSAEDAQAGFGSFVDVRDVAKIHVESLLNDKAGNERFLVATTDSSYQPLLDLYFEYAPEDVKSVFPNAERGKPGNPKPKANTIDTSKVRNTFHWQPIADKDTVLDMAKSLAEYQKTRWQ